MKIQVSYFYFVLIVSQDVWCFGQNERTESIGDFLQITIPSIALSLALLLNEKSHFLWSDISAFSASIILTHSVKVLIDKKRPNEATDGFTFSSEYAVSAFSDAALPYKRFGRKIGIPPYLLTGFVGWTKMNAKRLNLWNALGDFILEMVSILFYSKENSKTQFVLSSINHHHMFGAVMRV